MTPPDPITGLSDFMDLKGPMTDDEYLKFLVQVTERAASVTSFYDDTTMIEFWRGVDGRLHPVAAASRPKIRVADDPELNARLNEDRVCISRNGYAAIFDGVSDRSKARWDLDGEQVTGGVFASRVLSRALEEMPPGLDRDAVLECLTTALDDAITAAGGDRDGVKRPGATAVIVAQDRDEIWAVGSARIRFAGEVISSETEVDAPMCDMRSQLLLRWLQGPQQRERIEALLDGGADPTAAVLAPIMKVQHALLNAGAEYRYSYVCVNGTKVPRDAATCKIIDVRGVDHVVTTSDGVFGDMLTPTELRHQLAHPHGSVGSIPREAEPSLNSLFDGQDEARFLNVLMMNTGVAPGTGTDAGFKGVTTSPDARCFVPHGAAREFLVDRLCRSLARPDVTPLEEWPAAVMALSERFAAIHARLEAGDALESVRAEVDGLFIELASLGHGLEYEWDQEAPSVTPPSIAR